MNDLTREEVLGFPGVNLCECLTFRDAEIDIPDGPQTVPVARRPLTQPGPTEGTCPLENTRTECYSCATTPVPLDQAQDPALVRGLAYFQDSGR